MKHGPRGRVLCRVILAITLLTVVQGCNSRQERASVSGKVTFDGQPLSNGQIVFEPMGAGRLGIAQIADGAYTMPAQQGPSPGKYLVRITANRPTGEKVSAGGRAADAAPVDVVEQFIPPRYNDRSELNVEIGAEGEVVRDFELRSAAE
jgi:hypothetical protein